MEKFEQTYYYQFPKQQKLLSLKELIMILEYLRSETAALHREVELAFYGNEIKNKTLTLREYGIMLNKNHYIFKKLEDHIGIKFEEYFPNAEFQGVLHRHQLLWQDLANQNIEPVDYRINPPRYECSSEILGALYVIEGSMLGGQMIARALKSNQNLSLISEHFFYNSDLNVGERWKNFKKFIADFNGDTDNYEQILIGAKQTFEFYKKVYKIDVQ